MQISHATFTAVRPYLYHLTDRANLEQLIAHRRIDCATRLLVASGHGSVVSTKRRGQLAVSYDGGQVSIRDQDPLYAGNVAFEGNWAMADLLASLNGRVYFWPGTAKGPIPYGQRHYERYQADGPVIIRVDTAAMFRVNHPNSPEFCRYNSGSPRCNEGRKSPRGPETFVTAERADYTAGKVVEVTFRNEALLPDVVEVGDRPGGPWRRV